MREKDALDAVLAEQNSYSRSLNDKLTDYSNLEKCWQLIPKNETLPDLKLYAGDHDIGIDAPDIQSFDDIIETEIQVYMILKNKNICLNKLQMDHDTRQLSLQCADMSGQVKAIIQDATQEYQSYGPLFIEYSF